MTTRTEPATAPLRAGQTAPGDSHSAAVHCRILGALWGHAAGDALGATVEFMTPDAIADRYGTHRDISGGGAFGWRPGQGTDDTDLAWAVARAYIEAPFFVLTEVASAFMDWYRLDPKDIGNTTRSALSKIAAGADPTTTGSTNDQSCGNGSLMRALPTAIWRRDQPRLNRTETAAISAITHAHPNCIDACVTYNQIAADLINGHSPATAIRLALDNTTNPAINKALRVDPARPVTTLSTTGWVLDSLTAAVWAIQQPASFEEILIGLVNRGDDADTTAAIAGGLVGAHRGSAEIPTRWIEQLEYRDTLAVAADRATSA